MSNVPTLSEEINRKTFETLQKIHADFSLGKINKMQYKYAVDIVWSNIAGLVDDDLVIMMEQFSKEVKSISCSEKSFFWNPTNGLAILLIDSKNGLVLFKAMYSGKESKITSYDLRGEPNPYLAGKNKREQLTAAFASKGFVEL